MWYIVVCSLIVLGIIVFGIIGEGGYYKEGIIMIALIMAIIFSGLAFPILGATTGFMQGYSVGEREGYITKLSIKGVFWKTYEGEMQIGTGEMAALQQPFPFSIVDKGVLTAAEKNLGKKVRVKYEQWLIMPYRIGGSGYEITEIKGVGK